MDLVRFQLIRIMSERSFRRAFLPVRKRSTHAAESPWLITVASAAPRTPIPKPKMNTGSRAMFAAAPRMVVSIPVRGKPWAFM